MGFKKASGFGSYVYTDRTVQKNIGDVKGLVREVFTRRYSKTIVEDFFYYYNGKLVAFTTNFAGEQIGLISSHISVDSGVIKAIQDDVGGIELLSVNL